MKFCKALPIYFLSCTLFCLCQICICVTCYVVGLCKIKHFRTLCDHNGKQTFFFTVHFYLHCFISLIETVRVAYFSSQVQWRNYITREPLQQNPLCVTTWPGGTFRWTGAIQKSRSRGFRSLLASVVVDVRCFSKS